MSSCGASGLFVLYQEMLSVWNRFCTKTSKWSWKRWNCVWDKVKWMWGHFMALTENDLKVNEAELGYKRNTKNSPQRQWAVCFWSGSRLFITGGEVWPSRFGEGMETLHMYAWQRYLKLRVMPFKGTHACATTSTSHKYWNYGSRKGSSRCLSNRKYVKGTLRHFIGHIQKTVFGGFTFFSYLTYRQSLLAHKQF